MVEERTELCTFATLLGRENVPLQCLCVIFFHTTTPATVRVCTAPWTFYSESSAAKPVPVPPVDGVVSITCIGELEEGKARAAPDTFDLNVTDPAVLVEQVVKLAFPDVVWQVAYVDTAATSLPATLVAATAAAATYTTAAAAASRVIPSVGIVSRRGVLLFVKSWRLSCQNKNRYEHPFFTLDSNAAQGTA